MAAFVQIGIGSDGTSTTTSTTGTGGAGFGSATTAGNSIVVGCSWGSGGSITSVTDSKGNTYTQAGTTITGFTRGLAIFYCLAPTMGASHTVTMNLGASAFDSQILAHEVSGLTAFDAFVSDNAEAGAPVDTPATTPASDGAYLFGHARMCASTDTLAPDTTPNIWVERGSVNAGTDSESQTQDFVQVTAGSIACEWTASGTGNCICAMASFTGAPLPAQNVLMWVQA